MAHSRAANSSRWPPVRLVVLSAALGWLASFWAHSQPAGASLQGRGARQCPPLMQQQQQQQQRQQQRQQPRQEQRQQQQWQGGGAQEESCARPPTINATLLQAWGCTLLRDTCLDQGRVLLHSGQKTPGHPNWTNGTLFDPGDVPYMRLRSYDEPLETAKYWPPSWQLDIRAPTPLDPPDVWRPQRFSSCTLPLIFWPHFFDYFADFYVEQVVQFSHMHSFGAASRDILFVLNSYGMDIPSFYQPLLEPFSRHKVQSLQTFSSREHIAGGRSRCYSRLLLCSLKAPNMRHAARFTRKLAARTIVEYYKKKHPEKFQPPADPSVFRVGFFGRDTGGRRILNLEEMVERCRRWRLPHGSRFESVECLRLGDFSPETFVDGLAELQRLHAVVGIHGSGLTNVYFLPNGSAAVEVLCSNLCDIRRDYYFHWGMDADQSVASGYFQLVADRDHCRPGPFERAGIGHPYHYPRDQDIRMEFGPLARALAKIALGQVHSTWANFGQRQFHMVREEPCPAAETLAAPAPEDP